MATARSPIKVPCENEDLPEKENAPDFDEDTLKATADAYRNEGNEAFKKGDFINAIHFYTEGIKINCNVKELKARLYNNRAIALFKLGNHQDSLRDAEAVIELHPTFLKAIVRGATACVKLKRFEEAITWCDKGLAIGKNNRILMSLRLQSVREVGDESVGEKDHISYDHGGASSGDVKKVMDFDNWGGKHGEGNSYGNLGNAYDSLGDLKKPIDYYNLHLKIAKEVGDKHWEGYTYGNLGNAYYILADFKKAIEYHNVHLKIAKEVGDKHGEGNAYGNLGNAYDRLGDFKKAIEYHNLNFKIAKEVGDKRGEGGAFGNLGSAYFKLGDFKKAIEYHNVHLKIAKEVGDKRGEGAAYGNLGNAHRSLGDFKKAIEYHSLDLKIAKVVGDKHGEGGSYGNLGNDYYSLGDFKKALEYHNLHLKIAKEVGDKYGEGYAYGSLGNAHLSLGDFVKAIEYHKLDLKIAKDVGDKHGEGHAYSNLGNGYRCLGDLKKAIEYHNLHLKIAKDVGDKHGKGNAYGNLGNAYDRLGDFKKAIEYHNLHLEIAKEVGDKHGEGRAYGNLDNAYDHLGDFKKAIEYHNLDLKIAKEVGDQHMEGGAYGNLGNAYYSLGDLKKAIEYHNQNLKIAKEVGEKPGEGNAYGNLGNAYDRLGDFKKAIEYHNLNLKIVKEVGDKHGEGGAYCCLGNDYYSLGDFKKAIEYHNLHLEIVKEVGDKYGEGNAYGNLGNAYYRLGDFKKAIEYHNLALKIAKQVGDKQGEGGAYGNLGNDYYSLRDFEKAIEYNTLLLKIAKEVGDKQGEGSAYGNLGNVYRTQGDLIKANKLYKLALKIAKEVKDKSMEASVNYSSGCVFELLGGLPKAVEHYQAAITLYNSLRVLLKSEDEWKVNFRNQYQTAYTGLWRVLVKQGNIDEALLAAEKGRAQALIDLMESSFCGRISQHKGGDEDLASLKNVPSTTVFQAVDVADINLWVVSVGKEVQLRQSKLNGSVSENSGASQPFESFMLGVYKQLGVRSNVRCENRSLDALRESRSKVDEKTEEDNPQPPIQQNECLSALYDTVMRPVADLVEGHELLIIPDGPLWLAPYAALKDRNSKYLCESFRIRLAPSLTSLRLIADCPDGYHKSSGALLVGDPWVAEVTNSKGEIILEQLPCAKEEVEMIGKILNITPITGRQATKGEVLKRISSVSLVHFAAHGCMETGQIALTPDPDRRSTVPTEEDYILTIGDVLNVQLRAKLVVLSCCHSGQGEVKAEGVVGIARAFMGAGARSVVVSLWAIDDEATLEFMKCFYQHLAEGKPASKSLNLAMKSLRESDEFRDIKYWAPFLLIGDDITLDFMA
ncbi:tetratricopeptide repeat protein 28-like isoform X2 [Pocillopora verrucosa]|uniref:tetratricopeptide repeat protein 28-like isoform X2 n=1 Tax=Pocillopora verrucosa TaxID=203993 RepID=UPI00333F8D00